MCLAIPGKLTTIVPDEDPVFRTGTVDFDGVTRQVNLAMVPEAKENDYVLVHVGIALQVVDEEEARMLLDTIRTTEDWAEELADPDELNQPS